MTPCPLIGGQFLLFYPCGLSRVNFQPWRSALALCSEHGNNQTAIDPRKVSNTPTVNCISCQSGCVANPNSDTHLHPLLVCFFEKNAKKHHISDGKSNLIPGAYAPGMYKTYFQTVKKLGKKFSM
jgi:hypothetical protein